MADTDLQAVPGIRHRNIHPSAPILLWVAVFPSQSMWESLFHQDIFPALSTVPSSQARQEQAEAKFIELVVQHQHFPSLPYAGQQPDGNLGSSKHPFTLLSFLVSVKSG